MKLKIFLYPLSNLAITALIVTVLSLGYCRSEESAITESNYPTSMNKEYEEVQGRALSGEADAQLYMGIFHANGQFVEQNYTKAAEWYLLAAENGNATAQRNLALLYDCGIGVSRDYIQAVRWYKAACQQNEPAAFMGLARFVFTYSESILPISDGSYNYFRLIAFYLLNPDFSEDDLENRFWYTYIQSFPKYHQNDSLIFNKVKQLAEQGDNEAKLRLAIFYFQGHGTRVSRDDFQFFLRSSAVRNTTASFILNRISYSETRHPMFPSDVSIYDRKLPLYSASISGQEKYFLFWYNYLYNQLQTDTVSDVIIGLAQDGYKPALDSMYMLYHSEKKHLISNYIWREVIEKNARKNDLYSMVMLTYFFMAENVDNMDSQKMEIVLEMIKKIIGHPDIRGILQLANLLAGKRYNIDIIPEKIILYLKSKAFESDVDVQLLVGLYYYVIGQKEEAITWFTLHGITDHAPLSYFTKQALRSYSREYMYINKKDQNYINYINRLCEITSGAIFDQKSHSDYIFLLNKSLDSKMYIPQIISNLTGINLLKKGSNGINSRAVDKKHFNLLLKDSLFTGQYNKIEDLLWNNFISSEVAKSYEFFSPVPSYYELINDPLDGIDY